MTRRADHDPPVAGDGRCFICGKERGKVALEHADPFCSIGCCQVWWHPAARRHQLFAKPAELAAGRIQLDVAEVEWLVRVAAPLLNKRKRKGEDTADDHERTT